MIGKYWRTSRSGVSRRQTYSTTCHPGFVRFRTLPYLDISPSAVYVQVFVLAMVRRKLILGLSEGLTLVYFERGLRFWLGQWQIHSEIHPFILISQICFFSACLCHFQPLQSSVFMLARVRIFYCNMRILYYYLVNIFQHTWIIFQNILNLTYKISGKAISYQNVHARLTDL